MRIYRQPYTCRKTGKRKRSKSYRARFYVNGVRHDVPLHTRDSKAAASKAADALEEAELAAAGVKTHASMAKRSVSDMIAEYDRELAQEGRADSHRTLVVKRLRTLLEGMETVADVTTQRLKARLAGVKAEKDLTPKTRNRYRRAAHGLFAWLVKTGRWGSNPAAAVPRLREIQADRQRRALTSEEVEALLAAAPPHRACAYDVAAHAGLRRGELRALRAADVDLREGTLTCRASASKNKRSVTLPLRGATLERLRRQLQGKAPEDPIFRAIPENKTLRRDLKAVGIEAASTEILDLHSLRTAFVTNMARANVPLALAQRLARHSTPILTSNVYSRFRMDDAREAVARLDTKGPDSPTPPPTRSMDATTDAQGVTCASCATAESGLTSSEASQSEGERSAANPHGRKHGRRLAGTDQNRTDRPSCPPGPTGLKPAGATRLPPAPARGPRSL